MPALGYNWGQLPALNQAIYEKYHSLPLGEVLAMFRASQQKTVKFIDEISDDDLTTPGLYKWMNKNTLIAYLNSITAAHFVWALKESKKVIRAAGEVYPMESREFYLQRLQAAAADLLNVYLQLPESDAMVYEHWTAKEVLAHLTFWHESFAHNVDDLVNGRKLMPFKGRLIDLNQGGVDAMKPLSLAQVVSRFEVAHHTIQRSILDPGLTLITYKKGSRDYTPDEHLDIVYKHIRIHLGDVNQALVAKE